MRRFLLCGLLAVGPLLVGTGLLASAQTGSSGAPGGGPKAAKTPDLADYRMAAKAITAKISAANADSSGKTGFLGLSVIMDGQNRLVVEEIQGGSPADKAGLKKGDLVSRIGEHPVSSPDAFREWLQTYGGAGATVKVGVVREGKQTDLSAKLIETSKPLSKGGQGGGKAGGKGGGTPLTLWKKPLIRVGVIGIEYSDVKHNAKISNQDWADALLSKGTYVNKKNPSGQNANGSLNDYFIEQSGGAFHLEGKVFDWVNVGKKRGDYIQGNGTGGGNKTAVLTDALNKLTARDGKDALKDIDAYIFIYAGDRYKTNAGAIYYPHAGTVQQTPYVLTSEGGSTMASVNAFAKIACQALGLPDLAAKPDQSASRSLGSWCVLSNPIGTGRPQHMNPWAKEKLGWIQPVIIDPSQKQKLILSPIEDSPKECIKVLVRPNGSEYYLLENRRKKGFDSDLPAEGLLIWRVVNDRPLLCESHGIDSPKGPDMNLKAVPFPSESNSSFTPDTVPSSRSPHGGGLPVHITQIQRLPDGRIVFSIGYEYR